MPEARINTGFRHFSPLFKLNRSRRFTRAVIQHAVNSLDFVHYSVGNLVEHLPWNLCCFGCHEIYCVDSTECNRVIVCTLITHDTNASHVGKCCKVLTQIACDACLGNLIAVDEISFLNDAYLLGCYFTDDADAKSGTREWLTVYKVFRDTELKAGSSYLILEEVT